MICHTDAVAGNRTTRDNDDEDADGDEDHRSIQRRVDASTSLDDARMRANLGADDKARTNNKPAVLCRVASFCPVERRANVLVVVDGLPSCLPIAADRDERRRQQPQRQQQQGKQQQPQQREKQQQQQAAGDTKTRARHNLRSSKAYPCCRGQLRRLPGVG